jgi:chromosome partitioning protein
MAQVIAITNHKGGVGKTTSAANIAAGMHAQGLRVLMIDLDPQANLSQSFGISDPEADIYRIIRGEQGLAATEIYDGLDILPATLDLAGAEVDLAAETGREYILRELLEPARKLYDVLIVDTPPSLGLLTVNALTAADYVYIPMQAEYLALQGLTRLQVVLDKVRMRLNKGLKMGGVFITRHNPRKVLSREIVERIAQIYGDKLLPFHISDSVSVAEAPAKGLDLFRYAPAKKASQEYLELAARIAEDIGLRRKAE